LGIADLGIANCNPSLLAAYTDLHGYLEILDDIETIEHLEHDLERHGLVEYMCNKLKVEQFVVVGSL